MPLNVDLLDLNVWLALTDGSHVHHPRARRYWKAEAFEQLAFCRITMLGLLRLLTNAKVMNNQPFTTQQAWAAYRNFRVLPEVVFLHEVTGLEARMTLWSDVPRFPHHLWTDCYLAAFAKSAGCRLVSFDQDFQRYAGLSFLHLQP